ncbi:MAG: hypothetical protein GEV07_24830 [Streptosporangiales bacterium]|nr:hypothetical protein [Streptosporangiales bacterium]
MATVRGASGAGSALSVQQRRFSLLCRGLVGRILVIAALGLLGWCASLLFASNDAVAAEQPEQSTTLSDALLGEQGLVDQTSRSVDDTVRGSVSRLDEQHAAPDAGAVAETDREQPAADAAPDREPADARTAETPFDRRLSLGAVRVPSSLTALGDVHSATRKVGTYVDAGSGGVVSSLAGGLRPVLPNVSHSTAVADLTTLAGLSATDGQPHDYAVRPAAKAATASGTGSAATQRQAESDVDAPRSAKAGAAPHGVPGGTGDDNGDQSPVVPPLRDAPGGTTTSTSQIGNGNGSAGSHAIAEPVRVLAAWRPATVTWLTDADISSDDEGRPSVSPD